ncbi:MAG: hypothetical protein WBA89_14460 [Microcoleus sp.]
MQNTVRLLVAPDILSFEILDADRFTPSARVPSTCCLEHKLDGLARVKD